jgi:hypothetical protein
MKWSPNKHFQARNNTTQTHLDLQPPHWKPRDLSEVDVRAHTVPVPCAPVLLDKDGVLDRKTRSPIFTFTKQSVHMPSFLSSKPLLTLTRSNTKTPLGTIHFRRLTTSGIRLNIHGRDMVLTNSYLHRHWKFEPTLTSDRKGKRSSWYWKRDGLLPRCVILVSSKKAGRIIARIDGNILTFEKTGISDETLDEIILTAVALAEHARRHNRAVYDLGKSIGDLIGGHPENHQKTQKSSRHRSGHYSSTHYGGSYGYYGGGDGGASSCAGGEVLLILVNLRLNGNDEKQGWVWELLCW